ncbi:diguanylate cyclase (GGDEF)-like protein [Bosea sp. AK1]|nr:diguanylate cyclase (GGDEF)-like protein [Bosea sp. AK1]
MHLLMRPRRRAAQLPADIEIEIISRLFAALPQILCIAAGLIVGSAIMAVQTGETIFWWLTAAGIVTTLLRIANIVSFKRRDPARKLSLAEARRWEAGYAYSAFAFTLVIAALTLAAAATDHAGGFVLSLGLTMALTAGSYLRTLRYWICAVLSTIAIGTLVVAFLASGDPLYQALSVLLLVYLYSIYESSDYIIGQFEELLMVRRELDFAASHDSLTGLMNRRGLDRVLREAGESGEALGLLLLDLDGFKLINDRHGHQAGDDLLKQVAMRLKGVVRPGDSVARLGGDEFALVVRSVEDAAALSEIADRAVSVVMAPFMLMGQLVTVGASVGVSVKSEQDTTPWTAEVLTRAADQALYGAKRAGKGRSMVAHWDDVA